MPFGCVSPRSGGGRNRCANVAAGSRGAALSETAAVAPKVTWRIAATCAHCRRSIRLGPWALGWGEAVAQKLTWLFPPPGAHRGGSIRLGHWAVGWGEAIFPAPQRRMNPHVG